MPQVGRQTMAINLDNYEIIYIGDLGVDKFVKIISKLAHKLRASLIEFLKDNAELFVWKPKDMPNINPKIISHELYVNHTRKPIQ